MADTDLDKNCVLNSFMEYPHRSIVDAQGLYSIDDDGNRVLEASSGLLVTSLGQGNEEIAKVLSDQAKQVSFVSRFTYTTPQLRTLTRKMCELTEDKLGKVFLCSGGSEAMEIAIKLVATYNINSGKSSKLKIISRWQSYHGSTMATLGMGGFSARRKFFDAYLPRSYHIPPAYCYRCPYGKIPETCSLQCAEALEDIITREGPETVGAFIAEPIGGASLGGAFPRKDYFRRIREICDKHDILLIYDEIMTGFGRTGKWFGYEHFETPPDLMVVGKGLSAGYYPLSGVVAADFVIDAIAQTSGVFPAGYTYAGSPMACAVGNKVIEIMEREDLVTNAAKMGEYLHKSLQTLYKHPTVGNIRGKGLMQGIEFVKNRENKEPFAPEVAYHIKLLTVGQENDLGILTAGGCANGLSGDLVLLGPPLNVTKDEIDEIVHKLDKVITIVEEAVL